MTVCLKLSKHLKPLRTGVLNATQIHRLSRSLTLIFSLFILTGYSDESAYQTLQKRHVIFSPVDGYFPLASNGNPEAPRLEYDMHIFNPGEVTVRVYLSPTKNYSKNYRNLDGIRNALSINDDVPIVVNMRDEMPEDGGFYQCLV